MSETKYAGANCWVYYADTSPDKTFHAFIKFGDPVDDDHFDESVFMWCEDEEDLEQLYNQDTLSDLFTIVSYKLVEDTEW